MENQPKEDKMEFLGDVQSGNIQIPKRSLWKQLFWGLLALIIVSAGVYGGYRWYQKKYLGQTGPGSVKVVSDPYGQMPTSTPVDLPKPGEENLVKAEVAWQNPQKVADLKLVPLPKSFSPEEARDQKLKIEYYKVGTFTSGPYNGWSLYTVYIPCSGMCFSDDRARIAVQGKTAVWLSRYSTGGYETGELTLTQDDSLSIPAIDRPTKLTSSDGKMELVLVDYAHIGFFTDEGLEKEFISKEGFQVYSESPEGQAPVANRGDGGFYIKLPDSSVGTYYYWPYFMEDNRVPDITWNGGSKNTNEYAFQMMSGCGGANFADVVKDVILDKDVIASGKTSQGETVYEYKDTNHEFIKKIYNEDYKVGRDEKDLMSYDQFVKEHPVFFWKDPFGRTIRFLNNKFIPMAECAKPVIYLYPEKTQQVSVRFGNGVNLSYTEPVYNQGWSVTAEPNGQLTNSDGKVYPYLFWEGTGLLYTPPTQGFVVKRQDVSSFLDSKLTQLGLNQKEIADFKEYWVPYMQEKPYYFVGFYTRSVVDGLAPLNVTPKPDTVIRVLMDYQGIDKPVNIPEQKLYAPARKGFTLVEWGGVKR